MKPEIQAALDELKLMIVDLRQDSEKAWNKYKFLQLQLDMVNDRIDKLTERLDVEEDDEYEIEIETDFDL